MRWNTAQTVGRPTQRGSVTLGGDDSVLNILQKAMSFGADWDNDLFAADMEIDEKELEMLYSENGDNGLRDGMERIRAELVKYEYFVNNFGKLLKKNRAQIECHDANCGWNNKAYCRLLLPHQVVHAMIYHSEGTVLIYSLQFYRET